LTDFDDTSGSFHKKASIQTIYFISFQIMAQNNIGSPSKITRLRCSTYSILWISSIGLGFYFLYAPVLIFIIINRNLYHKITDIIFASWESFNTALIQIVMGVKIFISGKYFKISKAISFLKVIQTTIN